MLKEESDPAPGGINPPSHFMGTAMTSLTISRSKPLAECLNADQARELVALLRAVKERADQEVVEVRDEQGAVIGCFVPHAANYSPLPPEGTPQFLEEMERRMKANEPALPVEAVIEWLNRYCGPDDSVTPS